MEFIIILFLLILNGIFAMYEIALVSSSKARLETLVSKGNKSAKGVLKQLEEPEKFLSTIQIGITLIGIISGAYGGVAIADDVTPLFAMIPGLELYAKDLAMVTTVAVITYLSLIIGELVPKSMALNNPERYATLLSPFMIILTKVSYPFVCLLSASTKLTNKLIGMKDGEERQMTQEEDFKGYIYDVGGPTANFRFPSCKKQLTHGVCQNKQCLFPKPCKNLTVDHKDYIKLMREIRELPGIKKVFIRSGIRFDYCMADDDDTFMNELCKHYISGQLRVAPEHISDNVLKYMGKPENKVYEAFLKRYARINKKTGKEQFVVPYLMSSHPGSTMKEAIELAEYIRDLGYMPEQVQDFYPTPSTLSTCMYYTGLDPRTMEKVYTPVSPHEKAMQRALIQYRNPENYELVKEALLKNHREDLIGFDRHCLIPPRPMKNGYHTGGTNQGNSKQGSPKQGSQKKGKYTITQNTRTSRQHPAGQKSADNRKSGRSGTRKAGGRKR